MMAQQQPGSRTAEDSDVPGFLSTVPADAGLRLLTGTLAVISLLLLCLIAPFARVPLPPMPSVLVAQSNLLVAFDIITAILLYGQFQILRSANLLVLVCGYFFAALMTAALILSFPNMFMPGGLLHADAQTVPWLFWSWHFGFAFAVFLYAILTVTTRPVVVTKPWVCPSALLGTVALAVLLILWATIGQSRSPPVFPNPQQQLQPSLFPTLAICGLSVASFVLLLRRRGKTVLDLSMMAVLWAGTLSLVPVRFLITERFQLGFYANRVFGLVAASFALAALLVNISRFYHRQVVISRRLDQQLAAQRESKRQLLRSNRALHAYSNAMAALLHRGDVSESIKAICASIIAEPVYAQAWVGVGEHTAGLPITILAHLGGSAAYLQGLFLSWDPNTFFGQGPGGYALRTGEACHIADWQTAQAFPDMRERAIEFHLQSSLAIPFSLGGDRRGVLSIHANEPNAFGCAERALFQSLAEEIGTVLVVDQERTRMREAEANLSAALQLGPGVLYRGRLGPAGFEPCQIFGADGPLTAAQLAGGVAADAAAVLRQQDWGAVAADLRSGDLSTQEFAIEAADATLLWFRNTIRIANRSPDGLGVAGYLMEITKEKREQIGRLKANTLLTLGEMATGMAHELRQPLAAISFSAENVKTILERQPINVAFIDAKMDRIVAGTERASALIEHMRIFARNELSPVQALSWKDVLASALQIVGYRLRACQVTDAIPADLPKVAGVSIPMEQILINLLSNAMDAYETMPRGVTPEITLSGHVRNDAVVLRVADKAGGIPPEILGRVFEPFFSTKQPGNGTGLGLALAYGTVTELGGSITVANEDGGAVFEIALPVAAS